MKKLLVMAVLVAGAFGFAGAHADTCSAPATVGGCTYGENNENTCANVWLEAGTPVDGCIA